MSKKVFATRRILALFLPFLAAERARRDRVAPHDKAFVLIDNAGGTGHVAAASVEAAPLGLTGLTLADARARVPDLCIIAHDPDADATLLDWLADACERFSPLVATAPPDAIFIDITGCMVVIADICTWFARQGITTTYAIASTMDAAMVLARFGYGPIDALSVTALPIDPDDHLALCRAGLTTIGALASRPRAQLAARFGPALPNLLARTLGEVDTPLIPRRHPPEISVERRFAEPVVTTETVLATVDRLMHDAIITLTARGRGGRRFEARLFRSDGHVACLAVNTSGPTRDRKVLAGLFAERIDALADPFDPGFGFDLIRVTVPVTEALPSTQLALEGGAVAEAVTALVDRLTTRLGPARVRRLTFGDNHIPEQAAFDLPMTEANSVSWPLRELDEPPLRPLHIFMPPQRIEVLAEVPDGPPRWFRWRRVRHDISRAEGPERIAAQWWLRRDGRGTTRDYYRVEDTRGRRFWLFRHGLYGIEKSRPDWFLHGLFA